MQAAQGSEPELCVPISVVATDSQIPVSNSPTESKAELSQPQLVLCGDRYQRMSPSPLSSFQHTLTALKIQSVQSFPPTKPEKPNLTCPSLSVSSNVHSMLTKLPQSNTSAHAHIYARTTEVILPFSCHPLHCSITTRWCHLRTLARYHGLDSRIVDYL